MCFHLFVCFMIKVISLAFERRLIASVLPFLDLLSEDSIPSFVLVSPVMLAPLTSVLPFLVLPSEDDIKIVLYL